VAVLGVLSWQLIEQDRQLDAPRRRGLVEAAADQAQAAMTAELRRLDGLLATASDSEIPQHLTRVSISADGTTSGASDLPFVPTRPALLEAAPSVFATATAFLRESSSDLATARALLETLASSADRATRAGALGRLAPLLSKGGDTAAALRAYDAMASIDDATVGGLPASLVAAAGRAGLYARAGQRDRLATAAATFARDLARGRWPLTASEYDFYLSQTADWLGSPVPVDREREARADAVDWLWNQRASLSVTGHRLRAADRGVAMMAWRTAGDRLDAVIGGPTYVADVVGRAVPSGFAVSFRDLEGRAAFGGVMPPGEVATRVPSQEGPPWTLQLAAGSTSLQPSAGARLRILLLVGLTMAVAAAGWYFIGRALARELRVARLQHDFVASVSHEFRSPLTSLAHIGDLLAKDRMPTDEHRRQAYGAIVSDTARLRELVEHLLDFGRFEAGAVTLRRERVDLGAFVADIVSDARRRTTVDGYTIDFTAPANLVAADVDKAAVSRAIWNLIDNAVKYSPECRTIWVDVARDGAWATVAVRDQGIGIPIGEREQIFHRFVRGAESQSRQIKGTGIGLALVRQIVEAHGGEVRLTSDPGHGSRFVLAVHAAGDPA
jgi:signal transduction histidine kinase